MDPAIFPTSPVAIRPLRTSASSHPHRLHRPRNLKYIHDSLKVVGQYLETHFRTHSPERPRQEVCGTHPVLERAEDMLDSTSADGHCLRVPVQPTLHSFQYMFVLPSSDAAIVAGRTACLERAARACAGPVHPQIHFIFDSVKSMNGAFAGWASIHVVFCNVDEVALCKEALLPRRRGQWFGDIRCDAGQIARADLRTAVVAPISQHLQSRFAHRLLR